MSKEALSWIHGLRRNKLLTTREKFTADLKERLGVSDYEDKLEELSQLQQISMVTEYMARFETLLNEVDGQNEEILITYFIGGFKPEFKRQLKLNWSDTLRKALAPTKIHKANKGYKTYKYGGALYNSKS